MCGGGALEKKHQLFNWSSICKEKKSGGLGIWVLASLNNALIIKLCWRFALEREFLWRRVIVGKSEEELGGWCSLVEREICCWGAFKAMTRFLVGDQRKIKIWQDVWQWSAPLKVPSIVFSLL